MCHISLSLINAIPVLFISKDFYYILFYSQKGIKNIFQFLLIVFCRSLAVDRIFSKLSLLVAQTFGKNDQNMIRDIENLKKHLLKIYEMFV